MRMSFMHICIQFMVVIKDRTNDLKIFIFMCLTGIQTEFTDLRRGTFPEVQTVTVTSTVGWL